MEKFTHGAGKNLSDACKDLTGFGHFCVGSGQHEKDVPPQQLAHIPDSRAGSLIANWRKA